jgi:hypothetical protein
MGHTNARLGRAFLLLFDGSLRTLLARVCDYNLIALLRKEVQFPHLCPRTRWPPGDLTHWELSSIASAHLLRSESLNFKPNARHKDRELVV